MPQKRFKDYKQEPLPSPSLHINLYQWLKPFLELAKHKGIPVSPDTHLAIIAVLSKCGDQIENEAVCFDYISPLLAKNKEDYLLLKGEWEKWCETEKLIVDKKIDDSKPKPRYRWLIASSALLLVLLLGSILYNHFISEGISANYVVSYTDVMKPVMFDATSTFTNLKDTDDVTFVWHFGDGVIDSSGGPVVPHTYQMIGQYHSSLTLLPRSSRIVLRQREMKTAFTLCKPKLLITQQPEAASVHQPVLFSVAYDSSFPASGKSLWIVNGKVAAQNQTQFTTSFDSAGTQTILYVDAGYVKGTGCDSISETTISIQSLSPISFNLNQTGKTVEPPVKANKSVAAILALFILFLLALYYFIRRRILKKEDKDKPRSVNIIDRLKGTKPPYQIPFKSNDEIIDDEPLLPMLAKQFKRRVADENFYLNIPQTIATTIKSEGFLLPVFSQKTKPSEYLILIEKKDVNSAQVKLFDYLVRRFAKSDVYLETFYFYDKPDYGFNASYPKGIYITRLYDLYPDHAVILFSNGYSFLDAYYPALNEALSLPYTRWSQRAIFTPVPYADWSNKEALLQQCFTVLPADMEGQLLLFDKWDKPEANKDAALGALRDSYKAKGFNANKVKKIKVYLKDEFLFQWLCAMAISPSIYWQTMLGIGDALQRERYRDRTITYSLLLKLVRIPWMRDAAFPEELRLDLLKALEPHNEQIARQTLIKLMEEAKLKMDDNSFAFEELYLQQMTDKFMLYSMDAGDTRFADYKKESEEFKLLWKDNAITDTVLKEYLKKEDGGEWSTLIGNGSLSRDPQASQSIDSLLSDTQSAPKLRWLKTIHLVIPWLAVLLSLLLASLFVFAKNWNQLSLNQHLSLVMVDSNATVPFTFSVLNNSCLNSLQRQRDSVLVTLDFGNNNTLSLSPTDTSLQRNIPYAWINKQEVNLHISSRNVAYYFDSSLLITSSRVSLSVNGCAVYCNNWKAKQTSNLGTQYNGDWYENNIVNGSGTTYTSMHIEPNSINGEKIVKIEACENNSDLLRIITQNNYNAFSLYYLLQTDANIISFAVQGTSYETAASAERDTTGFDMVTRVRLISNPESFSKSDNLFASLQGQWWLDSDSGFIRIPSTGDKIYINDTSAFTVTAEQQTKTTWGKSFYKVSVIENSNRESNSLNLYFLSIDSTHVLVGSEESSAAGVRYTIPNVGILESLHKRSTNPEKPATLPQSLNEIWHGGTSNRLISLFLPKNVIYYSVNDTKTYGTYNIDAVSLLNDGTYKIITKTNGGYKLFFLKNVTSTSFDLSVCQNFLKTKDEAVGKTAANCDHFNTMSLYYENDPSLIYLPVSFSNNLIASQKAKLNSIVTAVNNKTATINGIMVKLSYSSPNLANTVAAINSFLGKNGISNKITNSDVSSAVTNQPFTRSAIEINTTTNANAPQQQQMNADNDVKEATNTETNLGVLQFDEKSGMPDTKSLQLIAALARQLKRDTTSRIRLTAYYKLKKDFSTVQQYLNVTENLFRKEGVAVSRTNNLLQITRLIQIVAQPNANQSVQQSKAPAQSVERYISITVTGINFPEDFSINANQSAY